MKKTVAGWLPRLAATTAIALFGHSALAATSTEPVEIGSLSGAFLAARVAEVDNDLDGAIAFYKRALSFDPDNQALQQSLMLSLISQGRFQESLPYAEKLKAVADVERFSRVALAIDAFQKKDFVAAENWLKLALTSDLDTLITRIMTGWAKEGAGDHAGALDLLDKLNGPDWYAPFVAYHKALIAEAAGLNDSAGVAFEAIVEDPSAVSTAPETWLRASEAYAGFLARAGKKDEALAVLDKVDSIAPGRLPVAQLREAITAGKPVARMIAGPSDGASELLLNLAMALNRGGGETFVRLYLQYALWLKPDSDVVLIELASVAEQQEDAEGAIALYRRVPANSPLKRVSELQLGLNLADLDRQDEAIKQLSVLLDQNPDDMRAYLALGGVYASKQDYRNAADIYDRAVAHLDARKTQPKELASAANWNIYYQRGIAYERLKEWPKAEPNFRKALELFPNQPQVLNYLGYSWIDMNMNLAEGMDMIRKAVDLRPSDGYIVDSLGWAHYRLGEYEDAVRELERAVSLKPDDPVLNDHLGDAYWRAGRRLEATFQWTHARDLKPEPDVLATVQKKLAEGLPPIEKQTAAEEIKPVEPVVKQPEPSGKRSEAEPADDAQIVPAAYRVQPGQSLWSIAQDKLGAGSRYIEILDLNPQLQGDPSRLMPGQELALPASN